MLRRVFAFLFLCCAFSLAATPEMRKRGQFRLNLTYRTYHTSCFWNRNGVRMPTFNNFRQKEIRAKFEYGLTRVDTLSLKTEYERFEESMNGNRQGFREFQLGWRHHLLCWNRQCISSQFLLLIPAKSGYTPPVRYGKWGGEVNLIAYRYFCFKKRVGYTDLRLGYRKYQGFPSDQLRLKCAVGYPIIPCLLTVADFRLVYGLFNGKSQFNESIEELNPNYRLLKLNLYAEYCLFRGTQLKLGFYKHLWGQNVGTNGGMFGGVCVTY